MGPGAHGLALPCRSWGATRTTSIPMATDSAAEIALLDEIPGRCHPFSRPRVCNGSATPHASRFLVLFEQQLVCHVCPGVQIPQDPLVQFALEPHGLDPCDRLASAQPRIEKARHCLCVVVVRERRCDLVAGSESRIENHNVNAGHLKDGRPVPPKAVSLVRGSTEVCPSIEGSTTPGGSLPCVLRGNSAPIPESRNLGGNLRPRGEAMKKLMMIAAMIAAFGFGGAAAVAASADKPPSNPGSPADDCSHGNSSKPCKEDPQPDKGKDCEDHGQARGNEDHCEDQIPRTLTRPTPRTPTRPTRRTPTRPTRRIRTPQTHGHDRHDAHGYDQHDPHGHDSTTGTTRHTDTTGTTHTDTTETTATEETDHGGGAPGLHSSNRPGQARQEQPRDGCSGSRSKHRAPLRRRLRSLHKHEDERPCHRLTPGGGARRHSFS